MQISTCSIKHTHTVDIKKTEIHHLWRARGGTELLFNYRPPQGTSNTFPVLQGLKLPKFMVRDDESCNTSTSGRPHFSLLWMLIFKEGPCYIICSPSRVAKESNLFMIQHDCIWSNNSSFPYSTSGFALTTSNCNQASWSKELPDIFHCSGTSPQTQKLSFERLVFSHHFSLRREIE